MWKNEPNRLAKAKSLARDARKSGNRLSAHSIMLSAYITILSGKPIEGCYPIRFGLLALWHAFWLHRRWKKLNHNQLDVLIQFWLKVPSQVRTDVIGWNALFSLAVCECERAGRALDAGKGKPHQLALAEMTYAEVVHSMDAHPNAVIERMQRALKLEGKIRRESNQPQGLRQLVRIHRKAGELYGQIHFPFERDAHLLEALRLAEGEADTLDQATKIRALLRQE